MINYIYIYNQTKLLSIVLWEQNGNVNGNIMGYYGYIMWI